MEHWTQKLGSLNACSEAIAWAKNYATLDDAWTECQRGDWMAWLAAQCAGEPKGLARKVLVTVLCEIARSVLHLVPTGEERPRIAIETAEAWARGETTVQAVHKAANAAYAANAAAYAANAANAAHAADAAYFAADAADAAHDAAKSRSADILRKHYPKPPILP